MNTFVRLAAIGITLLLAGGIVTGWVGVRSNTIDSPSTFSGSGIRLQLGPGSSKMFLEVSPQEWFLVRDLTWSSTQPGVRMVLSMPDDPAPVPLMRFGHRIYHMGEPSMVLPPGTTLGFFNPNQDSVTIEYGVSGYTFDN